MKHYKTQDGNLILTDSSPLLLAMPFIAVALTLVSTGIQVINNWSQNFEFLVGLNLCLFFVSIFVLSWALIKKTFKKEIPVSDITQVKQSSFNSSVFYLVLENGKQRNLSEVRETIKATELLMMLRSENPSITPNFTEKEVKTR